MKLLIVLAIAAILTVLATWRLVEYLPDPSWRLAVKWSVLICMTVGVIAMIPPALVAHRWPTHLPEAGMASMALRLLLSLAAFGVGIMNGMPFETFSQAMVGCYLLMLAVEVGLIWWLTNRYWRHEPSKAAASLDESDGDL